VERRSFQNTGKKKTRKRKNPDRKKLQRVDTKSSNLKLERGRESIQRFISGAVREEHIEERKAANSASFCFGRGEPS